jgi:D-serine deaminase-like pyridoxal phosphate-dependent protein
MLSTLSDLQTPALLLDEQKFIANVNCLLEQLPLASRRFRPHLKSLKCREAAAYYAACGIDKFTVSTLAEAEFFSRDHRDLFYAVPLVPAKVERVAKLLRAGTQLSCLIDSAAAALACGDAAMANDVRLPLWIELDVDGFRTGILAGEPLVDVLQCVASHPALRLIGIMSYAGAAYRNIKSADTSELAERHRQALNEARQIARDLIGEQVLTSFGGTPAVMFATSLDGLDELRCGIHGFGDLFQAGIGTCTVDQIAITVLTSVVAHVPQRNRIVIDAGALALSKDRSTEGFAFDAGYGLVADVTGQVIENLKIESVSQELGVVAGLDNMALPFELFPIGTLLRILPNHADLTAAGYPHYNIVDKADVTGNWSRINYW